VRAGAAARAAGDGGRMGGRWWRCCASWRRRAGRGRRRTHGRTLVEVLCELVRAWRRGACLMDPATHGRCSTLHSAQVQPRAAKRKPPCFHWYDT
jgi:hypothetical protein